MKNSEFLSILSDAMQDTYPDLAEQTQQQQALEEAKEIVNCSNNA
jgi:hypothetical protein